MAFGNSLSELSIKKIEAGIRGIRQGTKTIKEANINYYLQKLKSLNSEMHMTLESKYLDVVREHNAKNERNIW